MLKVIKKLYMYIKGKRIWNAKMSEKLRIRVTSVPKDNKQLFRMNQLSNGK